MQRYLKIVQGPKELGRLLELGRGRFSLGRNPDNQFVLAGEKVSKRHCEFALEGERLFVKDLGSSNGLFVNGDRVLEAYLKRGDHIQIGEYILEVVGGS